MTGTALETVWVDVPEAAVPAYEAAIATSCAAVGLFRDEASGLWRVEGVRSRGAGDPGLATACALAAAASGVAAPPQRAPIAADDWLARMQASFPELLIGRRLAVRGRHLPGPG